MDDSSTPGSARIARTLGGVGQALLALLLPALLGLAAPPPGAAHASAGGGEAAPRAPADTTSPATAAELRALADSLADGLIAEGRTAGLSLAVVRGPDTLVHGGWGQADVERGAPATPETVYRIGSITKQFTAVLVQQLAAEGELALAGAVANRVELPGPWRSSAAPVTVRHLLTHTSGIPSYTSSEEYWERSPLQLSHREVLGMVAEDSLEFTPGTDYAYSNTGYYLLGLLVEEATGRAYDVALREDLLEPLGLEETSYCWTTPIIEGRAAGYARSDSVPGLGELDGPRLVNARPLSMATPFAAGALCSTVGELVEWTRALHGGRALPAERLGEMTTPTVLAGGDTTSYGYGLSISELGGHRKIAHGGGINGFSSMLAHYPGRAGGDDDLTVAVLANSEAAPTGRVEETLARAALGIPEPEVVDLPIPADLGRRVPGRYLLGGELPTDIRSRDGKLFAQAEGQREWRMLYQGTRDTDEGTAAVFRAEFDPGAVRLDFLLPNDPASPSPAFVLHQGGSTVRAQRMEVPGAREGTAGRQPPGGGSST